MYIDILQYFLRYLGIQILVFHSSINPTNPFKVFHYSFAWYILNLCLMTYIINNFPESETIFGEQQIGFLYSSLSSTAYNTESAIGNLEDWVLVSVSCVS